MQKKLSSSGEIPLKYNYAQIDDLLAVAAITSYNHSNQIGAGMDGDLTVRPER